MENEYGDSDAGGTNTPRTPEVGRLSGRQHPPIMSDSYPEFKLLSSSDLGDPPLALVLQWHIRLCNICQDSMARVRSFGQQGDQCLEYFGIVTEYSEYERDYAQKGNP